MSEQKNAVVLVSGGLDSATVLAIARQQDYRCYALSFSYGQRHVSELDAADRVARSLGAEQHRTIHIDMGFIGGSALTDASIAVPEEATDGIPVTYVPARNTIFLSLALAWAEVLESRDMAMRGSIGGTGRRENVLPKLRDRDSGWVALREPLADPDAWGGIHFNHGDVWSAISIIENCSDGSFAEHTFGWPGAWDDGFNWYPSGHHDYYDCGDIGGSADLLAQDGSNSLFHGGPDIGRPVLHPTGLGIDLRKLEVDAGPQLAAGIHQRDSAACRPLIDSQYELAHN